MVWSPRPTSTGFPEPSKREAGKTLLVRHYARVNKAYNAAKFLADLFAAICISLRSWTG
jgi:hypothetical protein